jgi:hypothetical protein
MKTDDRTYLLVQDQRGGAVMKRLISLLAAATAVIMLALPGFAQSTSYTWQLNCKGAAADAGAGAFWVWLNNGVQISNTSQENGSVSCFAPTSGTAVIPTSINGIQVNGIAVTLSLSETPNGCNGYASVTKSFDPSDPKISISVSVSAPAHVDIGLGNYKVACPNASASFSLK